MDNVVEFRPVDVLTVLTCDDCGTATHIVKIRRDAGVMLVVGLSCSHCGRTLTFERDEEDAA